VPANKSCDQRFQRVAQQYRQHDWNKHRSRISKKQHHSDKGQLSEKVRRGVKGPLRRSNRPHHSDVYAATSLKRPT